MTAREMISRTAATTGGWYLWGINILQPTITSSPFHLYLDCHLFQDIQLIQRDSGAPGHGREGIIRNRDGETRLRPDQQIEVLEQRPASGKDDPAVDNVPGQFGRCVLEGVPDRVHDEADGFVDRLPDLI